MSRSRNLKPGFFKNEELAELPYEFRILFQGLWCLADREGRLEDRPKRIKAEVFPYDNVDVAVGLAELERAGFIARYAADHLPCIQILAFAKHQNPHCKEAASTIPAQCKPGARTEISGTSRADSLNPITDSPLVGNGADAPTPKRGKPNKTPMPADFGISERVRSWAAKKGFGRLDEHLESFRTKAAKHGYAYADWDAAFMEAVREDWAKLPAVAPSAVPRGPPAPPSESKFEAAVQHARNLHHAGAIDETERDRLIAEATAKHRGIA